jgi:hypothetical protein
MGIHTIHSPERKNVKDYRERGGIIFEGTCDFCGGDFYAKRRTACYCSKECWTMAQKFTRTKDENGNSILVPKDKIIKKNNDQKSIKAEEVKPVSNYRKPSKGTLNMLERVKAKGKKMSGNAIRQKLAELKRKAKEREAKS